MQALGAINREIYLSSLHIYFSTDVRITIKLVQQGVVWALSPSLCPVHHDVTTLATSYPFPPPPCVVALQVAPFPVFGFSCRFVEQFESMKRVRLALWFQTRQRGKESREDTRIWSESRKKGEWQTRQRGQRNRGRRRRRWTKPEPGNQSALWGTGRKAPEKYHFYIAEPQWWNILKSPWVRWDFSSNQDKFDEVHAVTDWSFHPREHSSLLLLDLSMCVCLFVPYIQVYSVKFQNKNTHSPPPVFVCATYTSVYSVKFKNTNTHSPPPGKVG